MPEQITINFEKNRLRNNLLTGLFGIVISILWYVFINNSLWIALTWFASGIIQIIAYLLERKNQYLIISQNKISRFVLFFRRTINISDLKKVTRLRHSYVFETENKKLRIDKDVISKNSLDELNDFIENLKLTA